MPFGIENYVEGIMQAMYTGDRAIHIWLAGFREIDKNSHYSPKKVEDYTENQETKYREFSHFSYGSFIAGHEIPYLEGNLPLFYLPISDKHHFELAFLDEGGRYKFVYDSCRKCKDIDSHGFPHAELRMSINLPKGEGIMAIETRRGPKQLDRETMRMAYHAFQDFIEATKV